MQSFELVVGAGSGCRRSFPATRELESTSYLLCIGSLVEGSVTVLTRRRRRFGTSGTAEAMCRRTARLCFARSTGGGRYGNLGRETNTYSVNLHEYVFTSSNSLILIPRPLELWCVTPFINFIDNYRVFFRIIYF